MTAGAQQALRRTMEIYANTTRFALACNMSNKIIEPIQSRCAILRYSKLRDQEILKRLLEICEMEKVRSFPFFVVSVVLMYEHVRLSTTKTASPRSSSPPKATCVKQSTTCNRHIQGSGSSQQTTSSKSVTSHTLLSYRI